MGAGLKTVAVLPQPVVESEQFLSGEGVHVDQVKQVAMGGIGVMGTPTMILVNSAGVVTKVWSGKVKPENVYQLRLNRRVRNAYPSRFQVQGLQKAVLFEVRYNHAELTASDHEMGSRNLDGR